MTIRSFSMSFLQCTFTHFIRTYVFLLFSIWHFHSIANFIISFLLYIFWCRFESTELKLRNDNFSPKILFHSIKRKNGKKVFSEVFYFLGIEKIETLKKTIHLVLCGTITCTGKTRLFLKRIHALGTWINKQNTKVDLHELIRRSAVRPEHNAIKTLETQYIFTMTNVQLLMHAKLYRFGWFEHTAKWPWIDFWVYMWAVKASCPFCAF